MKCAICARETNLGEAYALPFLARIGDSLKNLYACSRPCRDEWLDAQRQVKQIQADFSASHHAADAPQEEN